MTKNKKIALATLPVLALVLIGSSVASAHMGRFAELTEEQEAALEESRELFKEGNKEEAKSILKEAGLNPGMRRGHFYREITEEEREAHRARHEAVEAALLNNDFTAFRDATADAPFAELVTEDNFAKLVEAHALRESGDFKGAHAILKDLGLPGHGHRGMREGKGEE